MRGDIHHLFACEVGCNSFRGNFPYFDFPDTQAAVREACGRLEDIGFEPGAGKGPVARATLYFLLRYPGVVGDASASSTAERLAMLARLARERSGQRVRAPPKLRDRRASGQSQPDDRPSGLGAEDRLRGSLGVTQRTVQPASRTVVVRRGSLPGPRALSGEDRSHLRVLGNQRGAKLRQPRLLLIGYRRRIARIEEHRLAPGEQRLEPILDRRMRPRPGIQSARP